MQPFQVVQVTGSDIKGFKTMGDKSIKQNLVCNDGEKVLIISAMWFSYGYSDEIDPATGRETTIEHPNEVWCRYTHNSPENWKKVKLFKRGVKPEKCFAKSKYEDKICIKASKYKDLNNLVQRGLLSQEVSAFYKNLPCESYSNEQDYDSEYEDDYID